MSEAPRRIETVAVIGLGDMGSALARALLEGGRGLVVYNRTPAKANPLVDDGARRGETAEDTVGSADLVLVCVTDYAATREILEPEAVARALSGRILVQLSTGTPAEARALSAWASERGVAYLDGAIDCFPHQIGHEEGTIRLAGAHAVFEAARPVLDALGGEVALFSDDVAAVCALDCGILNCLLGMIWGYLQGVAIGTAHGVSPADFTAARLRMYFEDAEILRDAAERIESRSFSETDATVASWGASLQRIRSASRDAGLDTGVVDALCALFERGQREGLGSSDASALVDLIRRP